MTTYVRAQVHPDENCGWTPDKGDPYKHWWKATYDDVNYDQILHDNEVKQQVLEDLAATRISLVPWYKLIQEDPRRYLQLWYRRWMWKLFRVY